MTILINILTFLFAIISLIILKQKRYKTMPLISIILFISFIGFFCISILLMLNPYSEIFIYPFGAMIIGLLCILLGLNDLHSVFRCSVKIEGVYCGYNTYYGGKGISTQAPVFEYTYNNQHYHEQTTQNISYKQLNQNMVKGNIYPIYVNPKYPAVYILVKKIKITTIITILIGSFLFTFGIFMTSEIFPIFLEIIKM